MTRITGLCVTAAAIAICLTGPSPVLSAQDGIEQALEKSTAQLIDSGVDRRAIARDKALILGLSENVLQIVERKEDAPILAASAWCSLRAPRTIEPPREMKQRIDLFKNADDENRREAFLATANAMGKLTLSSSPAGARIHVDGIAWTVDTNTSRFVDEGSHVVVVTLSGMEQSRRVNVRKRAETKVDFKF